MVSVKNFKKEKQKEIKEITDHYAKNLGMMDPDGTLIVTKEMADLVGLGENMRIETELDQRRSDRLFSEAMNSGEVSDFLLALREGIRRSR